MAQLSKGILLFALTTVCDVLTVLVFIIYKAWRRCRKQGRHLEEGLGKMESGSASLPGSQLGNVEPRINLMRTGASHTAGKLEGGEIRGSGWGFEDGTWLRGRADDFQGQIGPVGTKGRARALSRTAPGAGQDALEIIGKGAAGVMNIRRAQNGTESYSEFAAVHKPYPAVTIGDNANSAGGSQRLGLWNPHPAQHNLTEGDNVLTYI